MTIDPKDLSTLYFGAKAEEKELNDDKDSNAEVFFVNPSIVVQTATKDGNKVVHGRGILAVKDIAAGDCIFVTPPTVGVNIESIKSKVRESDIALEELAMEDLIDQMMEDIQSRRIKKINSFLCLMGSTKDNGKEVTIDMLNGQDDTEVWSEEELQGLGRKEMKDTLLKNGKRRRTKDFLTHHLLIFDIL